ncbi:MAG: TRL-like family protein [Zoogloeaceae bacterium]|jgi:hypothetical protein|nr:TRL-like family protein [Zoogloeaceae bacterium]
MKKVLALASLLALVGCASASSPVMGGLYTDVQGPITATTGSGASKTGQATCKSILGWIALGDCSVDAAKKDGGISNVSSIDHKSTNILGLYATFTTVVKGN